MDAFDAIYNRRSIRSYTDQPVGQDVIEDLLRAAMAAPSAGNQQPWQFVVIDDRRILDAIPEYHEYSAMLKQAPLAIVVCGDARLAKLEGYWAQDCSAATQNLLLAAHASGLGAVWLGVYPREERVAAVRQVLGIPETVVPLNLISIGHPAEEKEPRTQYDESRVHRERW